MRTTADATPEGVTAEGATPRVGGEHLVPVPALSGPWSIVKYAQHPLARFEAARALSSRAVAFRVLGSRYILLFEPAMLEQLLVARHAEFSKDQFTRDLRCVLGTGLLTSEGELWRRRRKLVAPSFQRGEVAAYVPVMGECAEAFLREQPEAVVFDVHSSMMHLTLDVLVRALFGTRVSRSAEVGQLLDRLMLDYLPISEAMRAALPAWFPVPSRGRLRRISKQLDVILLELIAERRAALDSATSQPGHEPQQDLLTRLMRASDEAGSLNEAALRDEAMTLFLAGHETTALALTYALRLLALNPESADCLRQELDSVLAGRTPRMEDVNRLRYTRAVVDEALRLYPPAWAFGREALEDLELCGLHVPKGTQLLASPWVMHRDARFFAEPERFWPERWFGPPPPRFAYLPFGAGPRVCIGQHFALAEAVILLATLVQRAHFVLEPGQRLQLFPAVTLRPRGAVKMRMTLRSSVGAE